MMHREAVLRTGIKQIALFNYTFFKQENIDWEEYKKYLEKVKSEKILIGFIIQNMIHIVLL
jgi:hypothetical protein